MTERKLSYRIVDVFTDRMFGGNPLAVFVDGRGLTNAEMQALAKEMNLSETTFVFPPTAEVNDFQLRIFTPARELPMAGHPTIGTAYTLAREGMINVAARGLTIRFEENIGVIPVRLEFSDGQAQMIWMTQPPPTFGAISTDRQGIAEMLSISPDAIDSELPVQVVSCGVPFLFVPIRDLAGMRALRFRREAAERVLEGIGVSDVFAFAPEVENTGSTVHSRMFAPELGIPEDPATGSASGPLGCYLVKHGVIGADPSVTIVSEQGIEMGRPSFIHVRITTDGDAISDVQVGGRSVFVGAGEITLAT